MLILKKTKTNWQHTTRRRSVREILLFTVDKKGWWSCVIGEKCYIYARKDWRCEYCVCVCVCVFTRISDTAKFGVLKKVVICALTWGIFSMLLIDAANIGRIFEMGK